MALRVAALSKRTGLDMQLQFTTGELVYLTYHRSTVALSGDMAICYY